MPGFLGLPDKLRVLPEPPPPEGNGNSHVLLVEAGISQSRQRLKPERVERFNGTTESRTLPGRGGGTDGSRTLPGEKPTLFGA
jgi:hypothetical protein